MKGWFKATMGMLAFFFFLITANVGFLNGQDLVSEGKGLYQAECALCHLDNGLGYGINPALAGLNESEILQMLEGYQDGTYGGANAALMSVYIQGKSQQQLQAMAAYIATL